jgi:hypothetical protein
MKELRILGILVAKRGENSTKVQHILTKYGCSIKTRLGLNEAISEDSTSYGLILLELVGNKTEWEKLEAELLKLEDIVTKKISFEM